MSDAALLADPVPPPATPPAEAGGGEPTRRTPTEADRIAAAVRALKTRGTPHQVRARLIAAGCDPDQADRIVNRARSRLLTDSRRLGARIAEITVMVMCGSLVAALHPPRGIDLRDHPGDRHGRAGGGVPRLAQRRGRRLSGMSDWRCGMWDVTTAGVRRFFPSSIRNLSSPVVLMPEGHKVHHLAAQHTAAFTGHAMDVSAARRGGSRPGRTRWTGELLGDVSALGKHLFYWFARSAADPRAPSGRRTGSEPAACTFISVGTARSPADDPPRRTLSGPCGCG